VSCVMNFWLCFETKKLVKNTLLIIFYAICFLYINMAYVNLKNTYAILITWTEPPNFISRQNWYFIGQACTTIYRVYRVGAINISFTKLVTKLWNPPTSTSHYLGNYLWKSISTIGKEVGNISGYVVTMCVVGK
jgi:hypothetical protein